MNDVNLDNFTDELQTLIQNFDYEGQGKAPQSVTEALQVVEEVIQQENEEDLTIQFNVEKNWISHQQPTFLLNNRLWIEELGTRNINTEDFNNIQLPHNVLCLQFPKDFTLGGVKLKSCLLAISNEETNPEFFRNNSFSNSKEPFIRVSYVTEDYSVNLKEISINSFSTETPLFNQLTPEEANMEYEINLFIKLCLNFIADFSLDRGTARETLFGKVEEKVYIE